MDVLCGMRPRGDHFVPGLDARVRSRIPHGEGRIGVGPAGVAEAGDIIGTGTDSYRLAKTRARAEQVQAG
jgi:hypothetical protein